MKYDDFVGQVQHRARVSSGGEAVKAIQATLEILSRRLPGDEVKKLAAQLPEEIAYYLHQEEDRLEKLDLEGFFQRISEKEGTGLNTAVFHARAVVSVLLDAVSAGEANKVRHLLSDDYAPLFESGENQLKS